MIGREGTTQDEVTQDYWEAQKRQDDKQGGNQTMPCQHWARKDQDNGIHPGDLAEAGSGDEPTQSGRQLNVPPAP